MTSTPEPQGRVRRVVTPPARRGRPPEQPKAVVIWSGVVLGGILVLIFAALVAAYGQLKDGGMFRPEFALPLLLLGAIIALLAGVLVLVNAYRNLRLADPRHALGLPEGSVRAIIALVLVFLFFVATTFIFSVLAQPGDPVVLKGLTPAQFAALNPADLLGSTPVPATGTPTSYDVVLRAQAPADATDIGKNLIVLLGTLITAVSSFYFGSRSATAAAAAGAEMTKPRQSARPQITRVEPGHGPEAGGTPVTLTGAGFTGALAVAFGPNNAPTVTVESDSEISTVAPAGTGDVGVTVTTPVGASSVSPGARYAYLVRGPLPQIGGLSRTSGPAAGGFEVVLAGSGFTGVNAVSFGETAATAFTVNGEDRITVTAPPGTGTVPITVTGPEGTSAGTDMAQFTYEPEADPASATTGQPPQQEPPATTAQRSEQPVDTGGTAGTPPQKPETATDPTPRTDPPKGS